MSMFASPNHAAIAPNHFGEPVPRQIDGLTGDAPGQDLQPRPPAAKPKA
jgi:hypothetical protein